MNREYGHRIVSRLAVAANSLIVPILEPFQLLWAHIEYTSTAAVGNRQIKLTMTNNAGAIVADTHAGAVQALGTVRHYFFMQGIYRETAFLVDEIQVPIPSDYIFLPGQNLKIFDVNNVAAGDSMVVSYARRLVTQ